LSRIADGDQVHPTKLVEHKNWGRVHKGDHRSLANVMSLALTTLAFETQTLLVRQVQSNLNGMFVAYTQSLRIVG
jgi:hypothetical protein